MFTRLFTSPRKLLAWWPRHTSRSKIVLRGKSILKSKIMGEWCQILWDRTTHTFVYITKETTWWPRHKKCTQSKTIGKWCQICCDITNILLCLFSLTFSYDITGAHHTVEEKLLTHSNSSRYVEMFTYNLHSCLTPTNMQFRAFIPRVPCSGDKTPKLWTPILFPV